MVQFHEHIIADLLEDDSNAHSGGGLVILSSGLSLHKLIASLLLLHSPSQGSLLILSATTSQKSSITHALSLLNERSANPNPNSNLPSEITSDLSVQHRHSLYSSSSIFFITSRILIVDLLNSKVPTSKIAGVLILNAHSLSDTCTEAFIVRIFRSFNRNAYIRAFSDNPQSMVSGFAKVERIMKCLFLRRLHLLPRFQVYVSQDLERDPPTVVDVRVPMSPFMKGIQKAVIEAMDACLKEMRKTNKVDVDDLTVENGLFKSFDEIVRRQLDPIWHTLGKKTKQLVSDLKTLRKLLDYLIRYDAVTYLRYLDTLRVSEGVRSIWIFADSSHKIFELAKKRVYRLVHSEGGKFGRDKKSFVNRKRKVGKECNVNREDSKACNGVVLEEVLEEAPKWKILREILQEIKEERQKQALSREGENKGLDIDDDHGIVLVACKDERSCMQLEDCIKKGHQLVMREEWEKYLLSKADLHGLQKHKQKKRKDPKGFGVLNGVVSPMPRDNMDATSINKLEHDALLAAALEISHMNKDESVHGDSLQVHASGQESGKHKGKHKTTTKNMKSHGTEDGDAMETRQTDKLEKIVSGNECVREESNVAITGALTKVMLKSDEANNLSPKYDKEIPYLHFYALESNQNILDTLRPSVIIVYHPNITFVREIEIYKAENPTKELKVYFLFYEDSAELQKFEASIRRENAAFESLIRQKSSMIIPADQDGDCLVTSSSERQDPTLTNLVTRKAGGRKEVEKEMQVIVDMREFMSSLPNVLHLKGMHVIPVTLEVGDYVLSPLICVERKSISDLFQSFASGRLYHQVETMVRYYKIPVLLIEFSQEKSFSFQSASDIGDDVTPTSIISKLSLLLLHFPRLRLVWSRSLHATAEIFALLKANQDEPDESKAMRVGVPMEGGIVEADVRAENYNTSAVEFLRRLPGVTDANYRALMDGCKSLAELALAPVERLAELMGGQNVARTLRDFLDAKCPAML